MITEHFPSKCYDLRYNNGRFSSSFLEKYDFTSPYRYIYIFFNYNCTCILYSIVTTGVWSSFVARYLTAEEPAHSYLHLNCRWASSNCSSSSQCGFCLCLEPLILYCMFIFCSGSHWAHATLYHTVIFSRYEESTVLHSGAHINVKTVHLWSNWSLVET